ncbi:MAG: hypothetical protein P4L50_28230 [Anaerolineaceae bacterium]|nr:hypothetical protein [Anaerolineaceae bacterium]
MKAKKKGIKLGCGIIAAIGICSLLAPFFIFFFGVLGTEETGWQKVILAFRDPFYVGATEGDFAKRIPLIKPYDAIGSEDGDRWYISLQNNHMLKSSDPLSYYDNISDVTKIAVENGLIMGFTPLSGKNMIVNWFVLIPDKKIEMGFASKGDFLKYINSYGLQEPNWSTMNEFCQQFRSTGCLDWISDCKK